MSKVLVFDMDGTIADFYGVDGWLEYLKNEDTTPYTKAKPLYDMKELNSVLNMLKEQGWKIVVTTWLSMKGSQKFNDETRVAKKSWLDYFNFPYDELHMVKYGTPKASCTRKYADDIQILFDDNAEVRKSWDNDRKKNRISVDATEDIIGYLLTLVIETW